jgi:hypothetical protein
MKSKSIVKFRCERESSPPGGWLISTALERALRGRHERCHTQLFVRRCAGQWDSLSPFEYRQNLLRISSVREVTHAAA